MIYVFGVGAMMYTAAYLYFYAKKPKVFVKESSHLHKLMQEHMPVIREVYSPPYWCPDGRFQTIVKNFVPPPRPVTYKREVLETVDGGQIYLDWAENDASLQFPDADTRPTVFIVPGLTSTSQSNYVVSMVDTLLEHGYRCMVIINRGLDDMAVLTPKAYCATHTMDMELVIDIFKKRYPNAPLVSIGISLGSFKDLFTHIVDHETVLQSRTIRDYDSSFTAKVFGYSSVDEYYEDAVLTEKLSLFQVPTVCVCSDDDPFSPFYALPFRQAENTENVALIVTHGGGHVSHMEGVNPFAKCYFEKVMEQFVAGIFSAKTS